MHRSTGNGFQMTFNNGVTVSVQWNPGTYSDHYTKPFDSVNNESQLAEVWAWQGIHKMPLAICRTPIAYQTTDQVAQFIKDCAEYTR